MQDYKEKFDTARPACEQYLAEMGLDKMPYPWDGLEAMLSASGDRLLLVGYGSLLNPGSARRTVPDTPEQGHPPVIAFGATRVFNYTMSPGGLRRFDDGSAGKAVAALNVAWSGKAEDVVTGRLLDVPAADVPMLREREPGYHLAPVAWVPWDSPGDAPRSAFVLVAEAEPVDGVEYVDESLLPHPSYTRLCRDGARMVDDAFERAFLETTVLADGNTLLGEYLGAHGA